MTRFLAPKKIEQLYFKGISIGRLFFENINCFVAFEEIVVAATFLKHSNSIKIICLSAVERHKANISYLSWKLSKFCIPDWLNWLVACFVNTNSSRCEEERNTEEQKQQQHTHIGSCVRFSSVILCETRNFLTAFLPVRFSFFFAVFLSRDVILFLLHLKHVHGVIKLPETFHTYILCLCCAQRI